MSNNKKQNIKQKSTPIKKADQKTILQWAYSWGVVGVVVIFLLTTGVAFMTTGWSLIADIFYIISGIFFIIAFCRWEVTKQHKKKIIIQILASVITIFVIIVAIISNHYLNNKKSLERPFFTNVMSPKLIFDKNNKIQFLDWNLMNSGQGIATDMLGYSFIYQEGPKDDRIFSIHPQTWVNEFPYHDGTIFHDPSVKMMALKGKQYIYLYIQYKDKVTKKQYSQNFYFERTIYPNGFIEYSDAGKEHREEIDKIRTASFGYVDKLIKEGADIDKIHAAIKKHVTIYKNVSDL